jgi:hypothetical protein
MNNSNTYSPNGKTARLPHALRDQLNRRLRNGEPANTILPWLNDLPEVKTLLAAEFHSRPINKQNLSEWKKRGFRDWLIRQQALEFTQDLENADASSQPLPENFSEKLSRWASLQYAAATRSFAADNSKTDWNRLREFCADISRLRRADLYAQFLQVKRDWLTFEQKNAAYLQEQKFTEWARERQLLKPEERPNYDTDEAMDEVLKALRVM